LRTVITTHGLVLAALFAALTALGALVSIPIYGQVPFTLQVLFVLMAGLVLGPRLAGLSMIAYLAVGLVAPVYAGGASGLGALLGPTGGYLWGFVVGALLVGGLRATTRSARPVVLAAIAAAGLVPIYAVGAVWLAWQMDWSVVKALQLGVVPFVAWDAAKAVVAGLVAVALARSPLVLPAFGGATPNPSPTPPSGEG